MVDGHGCISTGNGHATDTRSMVSLPNGIVQTGKQHTVNSFIVVGVYHRTTVERKKLLQTLDRVIWNLEASVVMWKIYELFATS